MQVGDIYSEISFYKIKEINNDKILVELDNGKVATIGIAYLKNFLISASDFIETKTVTRTEIADIFIKNSRIAMTVCFHKQINKDSIVKEVLEKIQNCTVKSLESEIKKIITKTIDGEIRTIKGRHYGIMNNFGRVDFVDMEIQKDFSLSYDNRFRQVDPRTIEWLIVNGIKYVVK